MGEWSDLKVRKLWKGDDRFEARRVGNGLYLSYRRNFAFPRWIFRYRFAGKARVMGLGTYPNVSLMEARKKAQSARNRVSDGYDVGEERQQRKRDQVRAREQRRAERTVGELADEYVKVRIVGDGTYTDIVRRRIAKDIKPNIGKLPVKEVRPRDIHAMLLKIKGRGAPTVANDVLRLTRHMFDFAVTLEMAEHNPAAVFDLSYAGGKETSRDRWLTQDELTRLFRAMRLAKGFTRENYLSVKLLLLLAVRKQELTAATLAEFDLNDAVWRLPAVRTKTEAAIDIPLPHQAIECIRELIELGEHSKYLLPARKRQKRMLPHIHENTLNVAMSKVQCTLNAEGVADFTIHDFRRTARTQLAALGVAPHIAERCLNHKIRGVAGIYDRHDYFTERREALTKWAAFLQSCEGAEESNVVSLRPPRVA